MIVMICACGMQSRNSFHLLLLKSVITVKKVGVSCELFGYCV